MNQIAVPVAYGELIDKITILEIKSERIRDSAKLVNVRGELDLLERDLSMRPASRNDIVAERTALRAVNEALWDIRTTSGARKRRKSSTPGLSSWRAPFTSATTSARRSSVPST